MSLSAPGCTRKRVYHRPLRWERGCGGVVVAGETIHGHHLDPFADVLLTLGEPIAQGFGGASGDHVEEPSRSGAVNDRCEIDDDSDEVRVAMSAAVFPLALVDSQVADAAEALG